jgi:hypothetical protein
VLLLFATLLAFDSFAAAPNVTRVSPSAVAAGKSTAITFIGDNVDGAVDLWVSFPCDVKLVRSTAPPTFELSVPKQTVPGVGAIRLITTNGLSNPLLLLTDSLRTVEAVTTNHSPASAQRLAGRVAVDGVCDELRSDFYRVAAKKGERLRIEVAARRIGSSLDPLLRLRDAQGREQASNDDAGGAGADARLDFHCPKTGDYFIEVRDTRHAGGPRHWYRLRVGAPLPAPLLFLSSPEISKLTGPLHSLGSLREVEPNDDGKSAQPFRPPVELAGRFDRAGDRDVFEFEARQGQRLVFAGRTRSLGSPCDLLLQLQTTNGAKLAEANPTGADEGLLTNRFNADGPCRLVVEELNRNGGPSLAYRISVRELKPGFALSTETERISVPAGDSIEIEVKPERRDYDGAIQLAAVGLPDGFTITNAVLTAKTNAIRIRIGAPADQHLGDFFLFSLVGSAVIEGSKVSERTSTLPALRNLFPELRHSPPELDGLIALGISESKSSTPKPPQRRRRN